MGRLGKDYSPAKYYGAILLVTVLTACAAGARNDRYAGSVDAEQGVCGPIAGGQHMQASLQIRGDQVLFAPDEGVVQLQGQIDATGHLSASLSAPGADHKPYPMAFEGDLHGDAVDGHYATPRCRATVRMHRVS
jgi:hypothetical protein